MKYRPRRRWLYAIAVAVFSALFAFAWTSPAPAIIAQVILAIASLFLLYAALLAHGTFSGSRLHTTYLCLLLASGVFTLCEVFHAILAVAERIGIGAGNAALVSMPLYVLGASSLALAIASAYEAFDIDVVMGRGYTRRVFCATCAAAAAMFAVALTSLGVASVYRAFSLMFLSINAATLILAAGAIRFFSRGIFYSAFFLITIGCTLLALADVLPLAASSAAPTIVAPLSDYLWMTGYLITAFGFLECSVNRV